MTAWVCAVSVGVLFAVTARATLALDSAKSMRQYGLDVWDSRDGLPHDTVRAIHRTSDGYLWLGTDAGLVRFDGKNFELFDSDNVEAFNNNDVRALFEDDQGALWIGTQGSGVIRFQDGQFKRFSKEEGVGFSVWSIVQGPDGRVWFGAERGLAVFDGERMSNQSGRIPAATGQSESLAFDRQTGELWVAHYDSLIGISAQRGQPQVYKRDVFGARILTVHASAQGGIWIGTQGAGVHHLRDGRLRQLTGQGGLPHNIVSSLLEDSDGNLWIGTEGGLARYSAGRFSRLTDEQGLPCDSIAALHEDTEGSLWIGTKGGGLVRLKDGAFTSYASTEGLPTDQVRAVLESRDGTVWIATNAGLCRLRRGVIETITQADGLPDSIAMSLWEDSRGNLWVGTPSGVGCYSRGSFVSHPALQALRRVVGDRHWVRSVRVHGGWLWASGNQTHRVRFEDGVVEAVTRKDGMTLPSTFLLVDSRDRMWIGSWSGLLSLDGGDSATTQTIYVTKDGNSRGVLFGGHADADGTLWIGTRDQGLVRFRDGDVATYGKAQGLPANDVYSILEDDQGNLWMTTGGGICRLSKQNLAALDRGEARELSIVVYGISDGLRSREYTLQGDPPAWKGRDGRLWFCTNRGVAVVDPRRLATDLPPTPVKIQKVVVGEKEVTDLHEIVLDPDQNSFEVHYAGLSLIAPEKIGFRYRLKPFDEKWIDAGTRRVAYFTGVRPGDYTFQVQATNSEGVLSEDGDVLTFKIRQHWYLTPVSLGVLLLMIVGLFYGAYHLRVATLKARERELSHGIEEATRGLREERDLRREAQEKLHKDLEAFHAIAEQVANGDLTLRGDEGEDTLGRIAYSVNHMLQKICGTLTEVRDAAFSVSTASSEILATSTQIAKGAQYGKDEVHNTSSAVDEMAASMGHVAGNAERSAEAAQKVLEHLQETDRAVDVSVKGMNRIDEAVSQTAEKMRLLGERSTQVFEIIDFLDEIAGRLELLSLNAAIEASHAGDAGRGFSVVADEIHNLAERSGASTKDVTAIVKAMASETQAVLAAMEKSMHEVKEGLELSERARRELHEISTLVSRAVEMANQISSASQEQTKASQTVAQSMQTISNISEQSSVGASETTRAVRDLVALSDQLNKAISRFRIDQPESVGTGTGLEGDRARAAERLVSLLAALNQAATPLSVDPDSKEEVESQHVADDQANAVKHVAALAEEINATLTGLGFGRKPDE